MKTSVAQAEQSATCDGTGVFFPDGIIGFTDCKQYKLVSKKSKEPFFWFQAVEREDISFIIIDPKEFKEDYTAALTESDKVALGVDSIDECNIFTIVLVPEDSDGISANLLAPLVINKKDSIGRQIVLQDAGYSVRHLIFEDTFKGVKEKDVSSFA
ncbi:MAG: flagellar assembly protein FliW [PVC group bacterium]|nr:flagellar assembly protein FliW [PVC group bacterium]